MSRSLDRSIPLSLHRYRLVFQQKSPPVLITERKAVFPRHKKSIILRHGTTRLKRRRSDRCHRYAVCGHPRPSVEQWRNSSSLHSRGCVPSPPEICLLASHSSSVLECRHVQKPSCFAEAQIETVGSPDQSRKCCPKAFVSERCSEAFEAWHDIALWRTPIKVRRNPFTSSF